MEKKPSSAGKVFVTLVIIALVAVVVVLEVKRRAVLAQLSQTTQGQNADAAKNQEKAKEVVQKVRRLFALPADKEPSVASIVNVEILRRQNPVFAKAKNGDFLLISADGQVIIYDDASNQIVAATQVQLPPVPAQQPAGGSSSSAAAAKK